MSDFVAPTQSLTVEVLECGEGPGSEKRTADVLNGTFHATLLVAAPHLTRTNHEMIMSTEFKQARVKMLRSSPLASKVARRCQKHLQDPSVGPHGVSPQIIFP